MKLFLRRRRCHSLKDSTGGLGRPALLSPQHCSPASQESPACTASGAAAGPKEAANKTRSSTLPWLSQLMTREYNCQKVKYDPSWEKWTATLRKMQEMNWRSCCVETDDFWMNESEIWWKDKGDTVYIFREINFREFYRWSTLLIMGSRGKNESIDISWYALNDEICSRFGLNRLRKW